MLKKKTGKSSSGPAEDQELQKGIERLSLQPAKRAFLESIQVGTNKFAEKVKDVFKKGAELLPGSQSELLLPTVTVYERFLQLQALNPEIRARCGGNLSLAYPNQSIFQEITTALESECLAEITAVVIWNKITSRFGFFRDRLAKNILDPNEEVAVGPRSLSSETTRASMGTSADSGTQASS